MTETEKSLLLVSLQNGIGLSKACYISLLDIKTVSEYIRGNREFHASCINAIQLAAAGNLDHAAKLKKDKKYAEWQRQQDKINSLSSELTLWESYCKKEDVEAKVVMRAAHIYKTPEECATALGMYKIDFIHYIMDNEALSVYFSQGNLYNF